MIRINCPETRMYAISTTGNIVNKMQQSEHWVNLTLACFDSNNFKHL